MFAIDLPYYHPYPVGMTQAVVAVAAKEYFDVGIGLCRMVRPGPVSKNFAGDYALLPVTEAMVLQELKLHKFDKKLINYVESAKVVVIQLPEHGTLMGSGENTKYYPHPEYMGKDAAAFSVELGGYRVKVLYLLNVQYGSGTDEALDKRYCPKDIWKLVDSQVSMKNG